MIHLVCYDIATPDKAGMRRLRRIAKFLEQYGTRMQKSVFEIRMDEDRFRYIRRSLLDLYDPEQDSVLIYVIAGAKETTIESHGVTARDDLFPRLIV